MAVAAGHPSNSLWLGGNRRRTPLVSRQPGGSITARPYRASACTRGSRTALPSCRRRSGCSGLCRLQARGGSTPRRRQVVEHRLRTAIRQRQVVLFRCPRCPCRPSIFAVANGTWFMNFHDGASSFGDRLRGAARPCRTADLRSSWRARATDLVDRRAGRGARALVVGVAHAITIAVAALGRRRRRRRSRRRRRRGDRNRRRLEHAVANGRRVQHRVDVHVAELSGGRPQR